MFTLQVLDKILSILSNTDRKIYYRVLEHELYQDTLFKVQLTDLIIKKSLEKLITENYITETKSVVFDDFLKSDVEETVYEITWEGQFFISQSGYSGRYFRENELKERLTKIEDEQLLNSRIQTKQSENMTKLTRYIAILTGITTIYYLIEIFKMFFKCSNSF